LTYGDNFRQESHHASLDAPGSPVSPVSTVFPNLSLNQVLKLGLKEYKRKKTERDKATTLPTTMPAIAWGAKFDEEVDVEVVDVGAVDVRIVDVRVVDVRVADVRAGAVVGAVELAPNAFWQYSL